MRLNADKTKYSNDIIESSIKPDKLFLLSQNATNEDLQKRLLFIKEFSNKYSNSGSLLKLLSEFSNQLSKRKNYRNIEVMLAIIVDIMYHNPRTYPECSAIISHFINDGAFKLDKIDTIEKIRKKFKDLPNTEYLEVWLQRISIPIGPISFESKICKKVKEVYDENHKTTDIFNSEWLKTKDVDKDIMTHTEGIIDKKELKKLPEVIDKDEVFLSWEY